MSCLERQALEMGRQGKWAYAELVDTELTSIFEGQGKAMTDTRKKYTKEFKLDTTTITITTKAVPKGSRQRLRAFCGRGHARHSLFARGEGMTDAPGPFRTRIVRRPKAKTGPRRSCQAYSSQRVFSPGSCATSIGGLWPRHFHDALHGVAKKLHALHNASELLGAILMFISFLLSTGFAPGNAGAMA